MVEVSSPTRSMSIITPDNTPDPSRDYQPQPDHSVGSRCSYVLTHYNRARRDITTVPGEVVLVQDIGTFEAALRSRHDTSHQWRFPVWHDGSATTGALEELPYLSGRQFR